MRTRILKVIFYEVFEEEKAALKKFLPKDVSAEFTRETIQERGKRMPPAPLISVRTQSLIPLGWAPHLQGILTRSQGYDHLIRFRRKVKTKVSCGYLGNYCARAVAEHAILAAMALLRKFKKQERSFETFSRDGLTGRECQGKRALVIGVGHIGSQIAAIAKGLGMTVKGVDIVRTSKGLEYVSLKEGMAWADIVFCAASLTEKTDGMLHYRVFKKARQGLIFVNVSRGEISPAEDLSRLILEDFLGGVSLDVYDDEEALAHYLRGSRKKNNCRIRLMMKLTGRDNVLLTPHNAFNTQEALEEKARLSAEAVTCFLKNGKFPLSVPAA